MATLYLKRKDAVSADEEKISSRVQFGREDGVVGPVITKELFRHVVNPGPASDNLLSITWGR